MAMIENEVEKKVYKVEDVQNLLGLGRSMAYEFIVSAPQSRIRLISIRNYLCCITILPCS